jgi:hypothetical protein
MYQVMFWLTLVAAPHEAGVVNEYDERAVNLQTEASHSTNMDRVENFLIGAWERYCVMIQDLMHQRPNNDAKFIGWMGLAILFGWATGIFRRLDQYMADDES